MSKLLLSVKHKYQYKYLVLIIIYCITVYVDYFFDNWLFQHIGLLHQFNLFGIINIVYVLNKGVSFSLLEGISANWLILLAIVAYVVVLYLVLSIYSFKINKTVVSIILLIFIGASCNIIDRILYGGVVDYILLYYNQFYFPVFNLADILITFAGLLILKDLIIKSNMVQK